LDIDENRKSLCLNFYFTGAVVEELIDFSFAERMPKRNIPEYIAW